MPSGPRTGVPPAPARTSSTPRRPVRCEPSPWRPRSARRCWRWRKYERSRSSSEATSTTSPPSPPSPPSGPPLGTNFSRRNDTQPSPPRPPRTWTTALSWNMSYPAVGPVRLGQRVGVGAGDGDEPLAAPPLEAHHAVDQGEHRVVAAETGAGAGMELGAL